MTVIEAFSILQNHTYFSKPVYDTDGNIIGFTVDMQGVLLIDVKTIHTYLLLLEKLGLISSKSFHEYNHQVAHLNKGREKMKGFSFKSNEYKVFAKYKTDDKYYVDFS